MTCLVTWIGVDGRGQSSCYISADSRFSWNQTGTHSWDHGRKVFCSRKSPDIWGYYGDVVLPSTVIGQIVEATDEELLLLGEDSQSLFERAFKEQLKTYPSTQARGFGVIHCRREGMSVASQFHIRHLSWMPNRGWLSEELEAPQMSGVVGCFGSGKEQFDEWLSKFSGSDVGGTSRAVFQAFCKSLEENENPQVGGAPQLVSLYRAKNGQQHGIVWEGEAWLAGLRLTKGDSDPSIEFRDSLFERCDPKTLCRFFGAQPQPLPTQIR